MQRHFRVIQLVDQLNRQVALIAKPQRIISLVPSQTELLFYLGLDQRLVGITKFCIHPADKINSKAKIGGTKQLNIPLIKSLNPDLIIANKEENERAQLEELMALYPTYVSDPYDLPGALDMISQIGELVGHQERAIELSAVIKQQFEGMAPIHAVQPRVAYLIWRKPYMVAGRHTFIDDMLHRCGFTNAFETERYPQVDANRLIAANPDIVLLSSEPYPFGQKHIDEFKALLPNATIKLVDGEMFSWYGSRLLYAPEYFIKLTDSLNTSEA